METKPIVSVTYENERISIKKQLTLLKMCVTSLLCGPRADLWPFYGFYVRLGTQAGPLSYLSLVTRSSGRASVDGFAHIGDL